MLKAKSGDALIFGLSARNIELLKQGKPISVDLREMGEEKGTVLIFYGETEDDWPGTFIRGDNAFAFAVSLNRALSVLGPYSGVGVIDMMQLRGLLSLLQSSDLARRAAI